ncbi:PAS domain S-box protein [Tumidithrix elongata RA019]|uniref:histidine kinase n=1 Tax=Tumidithrix elongata BACA0141 TaxID=2716417 RepID=A0AAW9PU51_9CYAN|nr:PAS domain S-box protein [Tumidithrix elongata RA019]
MMLRQRTFDEICEQYDTAMSAYLSDDRAFSLESAYQIGCLAIEAGLDITKLNHIHKRSLHHNWKNCSGDRDSLQFIDRAADFFAHSLLPFATNEPQSKLLDLQQLNVKLEERVELRTQDLTQLNQRLLEEIAERQQTEAALNLQLERLKGLYRMVSALNQTETLQDIYKVALEGIRDTLKIERVALLIPDNDGISRYQCSLGLSKGYTSAVEDYFVSINENQDTGTLIIPDLEDREETEELAVIREREGIKAIASFPMRYQGKNLGRISVYYDSPHQFADEEIQLAKTITTYISVAITRKTTELTLKKQLAAMETSADGIAIMNSRGEYTYLNQAHAHIFGYDRADELLGKNWLNLYNAAIVNFIESHVMPSALEIGYWNGELTGTCKDGTGFPHELSLTLLADGGSVCISHDITKRKQAEFELRKAQQLLQAILDNSPSSIFVVDWQGKYMLVNRSYERLVARANHEVIGKNVADIWQPEIASAFIDSYIGIIKSRQPSEVEEVVPQADGLHTYFTVKFPLMDDRGIPYAICGISTDISDRKKSEAAMRVSENRLQTIVSNISDGIIIAEENGHIIFANPSAEKLFGLQPQGLVDSYLEMPEQFRHPTEVEIVRANQKRGVGEMQMVKIEWDSSPAYIAAIRDITDRKKVEKQIQRSLQEKEVLLKEVHHRVKNNLQVISSLLSIQSRRLSDRQSIDALTDCQERILSIALIHEQLYQAKDLSQIGLDEYIQNLANRLAVTYSDRAEKVKLRLKLAPITVNIETAMPCGLIVNELISNSFKHAFPNQRSGKIRVELTRFDPDRLILSVSDNGVGLPDDLDTLTTQSLGLMLIRKLARQLEGVTTWDYTTGTKFQVMFKGLDYRTRI